MEGIVEQIKTIATEQAKLKVEFDRSVRDQAARAKLPGRGN